MSSQQVHITAREVLHPKGSTGGRQNKHAEARRRAPTCRCQRLCHGRVRGL